MSDWPPATTRCPDCGHTVRIPITAHAGVVSDMWGRPVVTLRLVAPGPHVCHQPDQTPGE